MIATTDPESMTAEERRHEVANILARGLLRRVRSGGTAASPPGKKISNEAETGLELSAETRLSVARRPVG